MCAQCAVDRLKPEECVYSSLDLNLPAWAAGGAGGAANAIIQPAQAGAGGAGLAIRIPENVGRGSPTGMVNENEENEENNVNSNASRNPNATEEQIAAGRAKKQARRNKVARIVAESALNAGNESAKAVQAMAKAAGAGGKRSRKQKQKRKQKYTRKQK
jgi:hypothetical protein